MELLQQVNTDALSIPLPPNVPQAGLNAKKVLALW